MTSAEPAGRLVPAPVPAANNARGFSARDIAAYYSFPAGSDGSGTTVAVVSLYGGFRRSDLETYFGSLDLAVPQIDAISVDGERNNPAADPAANGELVLSLEILGSVAPGARIAVHQAPNHEQGVLDGLSSAVLDRETDVVCLPWMLDEESLSPMLADAIGQVLQSADVLGVPVCAPAGLWDGGALRPMAPGSHPSVLACTSSRAVNQDAGWAEQPMVEVRPEPAASTIWRTQGGARPDGSGGRVVPDVCALADEEIGYRCYVNGRWESAISPASAACVWAGLLARLRQATGTRWSVVSDLYARLGPAGALRPVPWPPSEPAWDSRVGWGSPDGERILAALG